MPDRCHREPARASSACALVALPPPCGRRPATDDLLDHRVELVLARIEGRDGRAGGRSDLGLGADERPQRGDRLAGDMLLPEPDEPDEAVAR